MNGMGGHGGMGGMGPPPQGGPGGFPPPGGPPPGGSPAAGPGGMPPRTQTMFMPYGGPQDAYSCNGRQSPREFAPRHHSDIVADEPYGRAAPGLPSGSFLRFHSASAIQQHPIKRDQQMIQADAVEESPSLLGVCDGVSEVQKMGIRP